MSLESKILAAQTILKQKQTEAEQTLRKLQEESKHHEQTLNAFYLDVALGLSDFPTYALVDIRGTGNQSRAKTIVARLPLSVTKAIYTQVANPEFSSDIGDPSAQVVAKALLTQLVEMEKMRLDKARRLLFDDDEKVKLLSIGRIRNPAVYAQGDWQWCADDVYDETECKQFQFYDADINAEIDRAYKEAVENRQPEWRTKTLQATMKPVRYVELEGVPHSMFRIARVAETGNPTHLPMAVQYAVTREGKVKTDDSGTPLMRIAVRFPARRPAR